MPAKIPKPTTPKPVDATRYPSDGRMNIPTAELEAFATDDAKRPKTVLYPRDPTGRFAVAVAFVDG